MEVSPVFLDGPSQLLPVQGGKSAVLLAIIIALGGKTASKGREKGLRSFIQDGKSCFLFLKAPIIN